MTLGLKVGIGSSLGAGVVGATAGVSYLVSQPKNLKEDLEKSRIELLNTSRDPNNSDDSSWEALAKKHYEESESVGITKLNIEKQAGVEPHPGIVQLKDECEKLFKKTKKDNDYTNAKKDAENWCSKKSPILSHQS